MKERYEFTIEADAESDGIPAIVSIRRWLKEGRRRFGLACIEGRKVYPLAVCEAAGQAASGSTAASVPEAVSAAFDS